MTHTLPPAPLWDIGILDPTVHAGRVRQGEARGDTAAAAVRDFIRARGWNPRDVASLQWVARPIAEWVPVQL